MSKKNGLAKSEYPSYGMNTCIKATENNRFTIII